MPILRISDSVLGIPKDIENGAVVGETVITADGNGLHLDLDGCFEKLARAQEHLEALDEALRVFFESDPYGAVGKIEGPHGWYVFRVKVRRQPPLRIGILMGEYVHQVRSSFDHFVWALASVHLGRMPKFNLTFPISTSETKFDKKSRLVGNVPPGWAAFVKALQPYDAQYDSLAILERFWNSDKHQILIALPDAQPLTLAGIQTQYAPTVQQTDWRVSAGVRLVDGAELARWHIKSTDPEPHMDMYVAVTVDVMDEGNRGRSAVFWDAITAEQILRLILSAFPTGRRDQQRAQPSHSHPTVISTVEGDEAARAAGFHVWRPG